MREDALNISLQILQNLYKPNTLLYIGVGSGKEIPLLQTLDVDGVVLVDADQGQIDRLTRWMNLPQHFQIDTQLIGSDDDTNFYIASNGYLSGVIKPTKYKHLMPNIEIRKKVKLPSMSLDAYIQAKDIHPNWIFIDTFDASIIIENGTKTLKHADVVVCTTEKQKQRELIEKLKINQFKPFNTIGELNPEILKIVSVKDYSSIYRKNIALIQEKDKKIKELENERETLSTTLSIKIDEIETTLKKLTATENQLKELDTLNKQLIKKRDTLTQELKDCFHNNDEKIQIINDLLEAKSTKLSDRFLATLSYEKKINFIVLHCMKQNDILDAIDSYVLDEHRNDKEKFDLCVTFALEVGKNIDRFQGIGFINNARYFLDKENDKEQYEKLIIAATELDALQLAVDLEMEMNAKHGLFDENTNKKIANEYKKIRSISEKKQAHGHDLLIDYIEKNIEDGAGEGKILVEIGTTRENIPGQGSTMQLAKLCKRKNIRFITVDMDAHNTRWATFLGRRLGLDIEAVTKKGEDYLRDDIDAFDFVFLDAYDFDHGNHSELRQSRYEKNLGSKIDEEACHLMHLECAKSVVKKLTQDGVVCVDDTWKDENGKWTAKGTLAVPYLLENNFGMIEERNHAVLMIGENDE